MRNECHIVRDLMPLCIDHAASQDSQELVDEHISTCETCAEIYGEMTRALPKLQSVRDSRELARTVRQMQRKKKLRAAAIIAGAFLVGMLVMLALNYTPWRVGLEDNVQMTVSPMVQYHMITRETTGDIVLIEPDMTEIPADVQNTQVPWTWATSTPRITAPTPIPTQATE